MITRHFWVSTRTPASLRLCLLVPCHRESQANSATSWSVTKSNMNPLGTILQRRRFWSTPQSMTVSRAQLAWLNTLWAVLRKASEIRSWRRCREYLLEILDPRKSDWKDVSAQNSNRKLTHTVPHELKGKEEDLLLPIASIVISSWQRIKYPRRRKVEPQSCHKTGPAMSSSSSRGIRKLHNIHPISWGRKPVAL